MLFIQIFKFKFFVTRSIDNKLCFTKKNVRFNYGLSKNIIGNGIYKLCTMKHYKNTDILIALNIF